MKIRKVEASDMDAFVKLYFEAYRGLEKYAYKTRSDVRRYFKWLRSRDNDGFIVVEFDEPVGFIACDTNWYSYLEGCRVGEIHELFVHPDHRRRGIGGFLLNKAIEHAKSRKRKLAGLWVGRENNIAKRFYLKFGFVETVSVGKWTRMVREI